LDTLSYNAGLKPISISHMY